MCSSVYCRITRHCGTCDDAVGWPTIGRSLLGNIKSPGHGTAANRHTPEAHALLRATASSWSVRFGCDAASYAIDATPATHPSPPTDNKKCPRSSPAACRGSSFGRSSRSRGTRRVSASATQLWAASRRVPGRAARAGALRLVTASGARLALVALQR
jgi:hypothetical protein